MDLKPHPDSMLLHMKNRLAFRAKRKQACFDFMLFKRALLDVWVTESGYTDSPSLRISVSRR